LSVKCSAPSCERLRRPTRDRHRAMTVVRQLRMKRPHDHSAIPPPRRENPPAALPAQRMFNLVQLLRRCTCSVLDDFHPPSGGQSHRARPPAHAFAHLTVLAPEAADLQGDGRPALSGGRRRRRPFSTSARHGAVLLALSWALRDSLMQKNRLPCQRRDHPDR